LYLLQNVSAIFLIILVVKSIDLFSVFLYDFVYDLFHLSCFDALVQRQYPVLKFNMRLLNYPHVDVPLTSYISLHRSPFSSSVSPSFPAFSTVSLMQVLGDVHSREKSGKYCTIIHVIPASSPPLRTYATISCFLVIKNRDIACIFMPAMPHR